ncbi:unnamed protein product [Prorocentrum cordatum]|uniref:Reverse transcriptase domain-containing protein n=2 Tax=Prorocentrum cordatum TaxID=2364126 RepID=A0ABN9Y5Z6_9DINO|nr:unnamed protein product [Polarella glacialis]
MMFAYWFLYVFAPFCSYFFFLRAPLLQFLGLDLLPGTPKFWERAPPSELGRIKLDCHGWISDCTLFDCRGWISDVDALDCLGWIGHHTLGFEIDVRTSRLDGTANDADAARAILEQLARDVGANLADLGLAEGLTKLAAAVEEKRVAGQASAAALATEPDAADRGQPAGEGMAVDDELPELTEEELEWLRGGMAEGDVFLYLILNGHELGFGESLLRNGVAQYMQEHGLRPGTVETPGQRRWAGFAAVLQDPALRPLLWRRGQSRQAQKGSIEIWTFNGSGWGTHRASEAVLLRAAGDQAAYGGAPPGSGVPPEDALEVGRVVTTDGGQAVAAMGRGLIVASFYFWTGEGLSDRNEHLLGHALGRLRITGFPCVVGGDFQLTPQEFQRSPSMQLSEAIIAYPSTSLGTCRSGSGGRTIDYISVDPALEKTLDGVWVDEEWPAAPHKPVGLRVSMVATKAWEEVMSRMEQEACGLRGVEWSPHAPEASGRHWRWVDRALETLRACHAKGGPQHGRWELERLLSEKARRRLGGLGILEETRRGRMRALGEGRLRPAAVAAYRAVGVPSRLGAPCDELQGEETTLSERAADARARAGEAEKQIRVHGAAGGLHCFYKPASLWQPRRAAEPEVSAAPERAAAATLATRAKAWQVGQTAQQEERQRAGIGADRWHPSILDGISDAGAQAIADVISGVERALARPRQAGRIAVFFIPKSAAKDRAIGLLSTLSRSWERSRAPMPPEAADPAAGGWGDGALTAVIMDLAKAFEKVPLVKMWQAGLLWGSPTAILAVVVFIFAMARTSIVEGCFSEEVTARAAIVAGSKFSAALLRMPLMRGMGQLVLHYPHANGKLHVDDLCGQQRAAHGKLVTGAAEVVDAAAKGFRRVDLEFSTGKRGIKVQSTGVRLGVDMPMARRSAKRKRQQRVEALRARAARLAGLRRQGRRMANGLKPSCTCGVKCPGLSDTHLLQLRRSAARAVRGKVGGASPTLALASDGGHGDPICEVTAAPIAAWATAVRGATVESTSSSKARRRQQRKVSMTGGRRESRGSAGECSMSMRRAGWTRPAWGVIRARSRLDLRLDKACPMGAQAMSKLDLEHETRAARTQEDDLESVAPRPLIAPIAAKLRRGLEGDWGPRAARAARQAVVRGPWAQDEWYKIGKASDPTRQACGLERGTAKHRYFKCSWPRQRRFEERVLRRVAQQAAGDPPRPSDGQAPPAPEEADAQVREASGGEDPWPDEEEGVLGFGGGFREPEDELQTAEDGGSGFSAPEDEPEGGGSGSSQAARYLRNFKVPLVTGPPGRPTGALAGALRRSPGRRCSGVWDSAGRAAMAVDAGGRATVQARGPLPVVLPTQRTIERAELWGFLQVLRHIKTETMGASEPCMIYTDHLAIVSGQHRGQAWCCSGKRAPTSGGRFGFASKIATCPWMRRVALRNQEVDRLAKQAAELDAGFGQDQAIKEAGQKVARAPHNIGRWRERVDEWNDMQPTPAERPLPRKVRANSRPLDLAQHDLEDDGRGMCCRACTRQAVAVSARWSLLASPRVPEPRRRVGAPAADPREIATLGRQAAWAGPGGQPDGGLQRRRAKGSEGRREGGARRALARFWGSSRGEGRQQEDRAPAPCGHGPGARKQGGRRQRRSFEEAPHVEALAPGQADPEDGGACSRVAEETPARRVGAAAAAETGWRALEAKPAALPHRAAKASALGAGEKLRAVREAPALMVLKGERTLLQHARPSEPVRRGRSRRLGKFWKFGRSHVLSLGNLKLCGDSRCGYADLFFLAGVLVNSGAKLLAASEDHDIQRLGKPSLPRPRRALRARGREGPVRSLGPSAGILSVLCARGQRGEALVLALMFCRHLRPPNLISIPAAPPARAPPPAACRAGGLGSLRLVMSQLRRGGASGGLPKEARETLAFAQRARGANVRSPLCYMKAGRAQLLHEAPPPEGDSWR